MRFRKQRAKPFVSSFEPNARLEDGRSVRVVGGPFRLLNVWLAVEYPDRVMRPVLAHKVTMPPQG